MAEVLMLLADGFEEVEAITPLDYLRRCGTDVVTAGISGKTVIGAHGIPIIADTVLNGEAPLPEMLILPGGRPGADNLAADQKVLALIRECNIAGKYIAAICAAPALVLQKAGILDGREATCYPGFETHFSNVRYRTDPVVQDGRIITSRGAGTAADFALFLIALLHDQKTADDAAAKLLIS